MFLRGELIAQPLTEPMPLGPRAEVPRWGAGSGQDNSVEDFDVKHETCASARKPSKHMSQKTKLMLKFIAVTLVFLALGMHLQFVLIPALSASKFWLVVVAFGMLLVASQ